MKTKLNRTIYWLLSILIFLSLPDLVQANTISDTTKVEDQQRKQKKKKKKKKKEVKKTRTVKKNRVVKKTRTVKKKVVRKAETPKAARVNTPAPPPIPHFSQISKADFISGKYRQLTIPYVEGGQTKWGVGNYTVGRYVIIRNIGINADGATYDYWKGR